MSLVMLVLQQRSKGLSEVWKEIVSIRFYNSSDLEFMPLFDPASTINNLILLVNRPQPCEPLGTLNLKYALAQMS